MREKEYCSLKRNNSIDMFRYLCSVMVVIIHSSFWKSWGAVGIFIGEIFPRIAVPFFFVTSGYFYIKKLLDNPTVFIKQLKSIVQIYSVWSIIYFLVDLLNQIILDRNPFIPFLKKYIFSFFISGSHFHFWYFPALIFAVCFVTLIYKFKLMKILIPVSVVLYIIGCIGCAYYEWTKNIPAINLLITYEHFYTIRCIFLMGLPFFSAGYLLLKTEHKFNNKCILVGWLICMILFLIEIVLLLYFRITSNAVITFGLYGFLIFTMLLLLNNPLNRCFKISKITKTLANVTYYSHPLFQTFIMLFFKYINKDVAPIIIFVLTILSTFVFGLILHLLSKYKKWKIIKTIIG